MKIEICFPVFFFWLFRYVSHLSYPFKEILLVLFVWICLRYLLLLLLFLNTSYFCWIALHYFLLRFLDVIFSFYLSARIFSLLVSPIFICFHMYIFKWRCIWWYYCLEGCSDVFKLKAIHILWEKAERIIYGITWTFCYTWCFICMRWWYTSAREIKKTAKK